eukprot:gene2355-3175_t
MPTARPVLKSLLDSCQPSDEPIGSHSFIVCSSFEFYSTSQALLPHKHSSENVLATGVAKLFSRVLKGGDKHQHSFLVIKALPGAPVMAPQTMICLGNGCDQPMFRLLSGPSASCLLVHGQSAECTILNKQPELDQLLKTPAEATPAGQDGCMFTSADDDQGKTTDGTPAEVPDQPEVAPAHLVTQPGQLEPDQEQSNGAPDNAANKKVNTLAPPVSTELEKDDDKEGLLVSTIEEHMKDFEEVQAVIAAELEAAGDGALADGGYDSGYDSDGGSSIGMVEVGIMDAYSDPVFRKTDLGRAFLTHSAVPVVNINGPTRPPTDFHTCPWDEIELIPGQTKVQFFPKLSETIYDPAEGKPVTDRLEQLRTQGPGCDASWIGDLEVPDHLQDYSDDEKETEAKRENKDARQASAKKLVQVQTTTPGHCLYVYQLHDVDCLRKNCNTKTKQSEPETLQPEGGAEAALVEDLVEDLLLLTLAG